MFSTKKHLSRRTFLRGAGVAVGLPLLDAMVPALDGAGADGGGAEAAHGVHVPAARRDHGALDAGDRGRELRAARDPQAAGAVPEAADDRQRPGEQAGHRAAGARAQPGHVAQLRHAARRPPSPTAASRWTRSPPRTSARTRRSRRWRLRPKAAAAAAPATGATAAPTATRSRSARRRRRCRWRPIRASCSSGCSARATRRSERKAISKQVLEHPRPGDAGGRGPATTLDGPDKARLGDYLESVREIERRVQKMEAQDFSGLDLPDVPVTTNFDQRLNLMFDMIALAYQANLTRVFSVHDGGRGQQHPLQPHRRVGRVPPAVAPPERQGAEGEAGAASRPITRRRSPSS